MSGRKRLPPRNRARGLHRGVEFVLGLVLACAALLMGAVAVSAVADVIRGDVGPLGLAFAVLFTGALSYVSAVLAWRLHRTSTT